MIPVLSQEGVSAHPSIPPSSLTVNFRRYFPAAACEPLMDCEFKRWLHQVLKIKRTKVEQKILLLPHIVSLVFCNYCFIHVCSCTCMHVYVCIAVRLNIFLALGNAQKSL